MVASRLVLEFESGPIYMTVNGPKHYVNVGTHQGNRKPDESEQRDMATHIIDLTEERLSPIRK